MAEMTQYQGGCHCGKVRYQVTAQITKVVSCNCSICSRRGYLLTWVPPDRFALQTGAEENLRDYQFGKHNIHHLFCKECGVGSFSWGTGKDGQKMFAINVRCLEGVDPSTLEVAHYDGKKL